MNTPSNVLPDNRKKNQWYGYTPDLPDFRDYVYQAPESLRVPDALNLSPGFPLPPFDQGALGSCGLNALAGLIIYDQKKQGLPVDMPSRLYAYYNTRVLEGTVSEDSGIQIRDGIKAYNRWGVCAESLWAYNIDMFAAKPPPICYDNGNAHRPLKYMRVRQGVTWIKQALAHGYPITFGFTVYESFESDQVAQSGVLNMPKRSESVVGGHAVVACGYDRNFRFPDSNVGGVLVRNSWGTDWGTGGYFWLPFKYITNPDLASDLWVVETIT